MNTITSDTFRVLLFGDTHIGLDFPLHPRIERRRRGDDFLRNFRLALRPALEGRVDAVIHGGDLFDRSRIPDALVEIAFAPLVEAAQAGVPVFLVPGNHERGKIPLQVWRSHANLHVFDQPGCVMLHKNGLRACIGGFPFTRKIQGQFGAQVKRTGLTAAPADVRVLCMHQAVEGAQVGPVNFTFRGGP
ncbi:MAG: metallophosphoesterase, partial [Anaerolineaceae bacterium]